MIKLLLPLVLVLVGLGAGVGAGIFLRPEVEPEPEIEAAEQKEALPTETHNHEKKTDDLGEVEYVDLPNQFVVPLVADNRIASMVVLSLSIEAVEGHQEEILRKQPKLRDGFLQVLFDHANIGGFEGYFTRTETLDVLRRGLKEVAVSVIDGDVIQDVLILEIARQDY